MPDLHVFDGDNDVADSAPAFIYYDETAEDVEFGMPPNLYVGLATGFIGALAGVLSLIIYFQFWEPAPYISPQWLVFACLGAVAGVFLRFEKTLSGWAERSDD